MCKYADVQMCKFSNSKIVYKIQFSQIGKFII
jgi:hypothetical protein